MRTRTKSRTSARWVTIVLSIAGGAILLTWLLVRAPKRRTSESHGIEPVLATDPADGLGFADLVGSATDSRRVEAYVQACPGTLPSAPNLLVRVLDQGGRPLAGARVVRWDTHEREDLGDTDSAGSLGATIPECSGQSLVVRSEAFATAYRDLENRFPMKTTVRLHSERSVSGRVIDTDGEPLPDMSVMAWPDHRRPSGKEVALSVSDPALLPRTSTDRMGRFRLTGLDPREAYSLAAGGGSHVLVDPVALEPYVDEELELRLWRLHGLRLKILAKGGGRPVLPVDLGTPGCTSFGHPGERTYRHVDPASPTAALTTPGRALVLGGLEYDFSNTVLLYATGEPSQRLGPIRYRICAPGYASASGELWVPPIEGGAVAEEVLRLDPMVPVFGPLEVEVSGVPDGISPLHSAWGAPVLVFARNTDADCEYFFPLSELRSKSLDGLLPIGRTEFVVGNTEWQQPDWRRPLATLVLTDQRNVLDLDLSSFGGVEFGLHDSGRQAVRGPVRVELRDEEGRVLRHLAFHRAPYRVYGLWSGEYSLSVHRPYGSWDDTAHSNVFRVVPGEFVRVECTPGEWKGR